LNDERIKRKFYIYIFCIIIYKMSKRGLVILFFVISLMCINCVYAVDYNVASISELNSAISSALPGDNIILADGTYSGQMSLSANGEVGNLITVRAETLGGVNITSGGVTISGSYMVLQGFNFIGGS